MQNIVYADDTGTIGFIAPGLMPIRRKGEGWMPAPGWTGEYDWNGYIPFDALPSAVNPPSGRFVSANNKIVPDSYPYFLSRDWDLPNRAERIAALLDATPAQTPSTSAAIQADTFSPMAKQLVPLMTNVSPADQPSREAIDCCAIGIFAWTATRPRRCCLPRGCASSAGQFCLAASATQSRAIGI